MSDAPGRWLVAAVLPTMVACGRAGRAGDAGEPSGLAPVPAGPTMSGAAPPVHVPWRRHASDRLGLALDVVEGATPSEGESGGVRYLVQEERGVKIGVRSGPGSDLEAWRGSFAGRNARLGAETATTLCEVAARRQETEVGAEQATGIVRTADGSIGHVYSTRPAIVSVAVAALVGGRPLLVEWAVPAAERARYRAAEHHFFASVTCR